MKCFNSSCISLPELMKNDLFQHFSIIVQELYDITTLTGYHVWTTLVDNMIISVRQYILKEYHDSSWKFMIYVFLMGSSVSKGFYI